MTDRQLSFEEVFALPEPTIQTYLQSKGWRFQDFWTDRISTIIYHGKDGWLTDNDRQMIRRADFTTTARLTEEEIIRRLQAQGVEVTALMTRFDLIRQLLSKEDVAGQLYAFGSGEFGRLGLGNNDWRNTPIQVMMPRKVKAVSAGFEHTMVITEDGKLFVFGFNGSGQLGLGDTRSRDIPTSVEIPGKVKAISVGENHTMVITKDGQLLAFGWNGAGQLGLGDGRKRNTPTPVPIPSKVKAVSTGFSHTMVIAD